MQFSIQILVAIELQMIAIEEEWNKMSEEFFLKAYESFRRRVDKIIRNILV